MKRAFIKNFEDIVIRDVVDDLDKDEIRIHVDACGICGTDITTAYEGVADYMPFGHEVAGTIIEIGSSVMNLQIGQKVILESASACGQCSQCRNTQQEYCQNIKTFFAKQKLGFAESMTTPAISAIPYDDVEPEIACLSEPLGVALDMVLNADIKIGSVVLVSGLGTIGLMAIKLARLVGAKYIYACDVSTATKRIQTAIECGANEIITIDTMLLDEYKFKNKPNRFLVSSPPKTLSTMFNIADTGSIISFIGIKYGDGAFVNFDANNFHFKKLQLRGSFASPALRTPMALQLLKNRTIDGYKLVTHIYCLNEIKKAISQAARSSESIKVVIKP